MTDWECGQDLCHLSDEIRSKMKDMKESHPEVYWMLDEISRVIGDTFNQVPFKTSHKFGLISHHECADSKEKSAHEIEMRKMVEANRDQLRLDKAKLVKALETIATNDDAHLRGYSHEKCAKQALAEHAQTSPVQAGNDNE